MRCRLRFPALDKRQPVRRGCRGRSPPPAGGAQSFRTLSRSQARAGLVGRALALGDWPTSALSPRSMSTLGMLGERVVARMLTFLGIGSWGCETNTTGLPLNASIHAKPCRQCRCKSTKPADLSCSSRRGRRIWGPLWSCEECRHSGHSRTSVSSIRRSNQRGFALD